MCVWEREGGEREREEWKRERISIIVYYYIYRLDAYTYSVKGERE